jgi:hypothetical protein
MRKSVIAAVNSVTSSTISQTVSAISQMTVDPSARTSARAPPLIAFTEAESSSSSAGF